MRKPSALIRFCVPLPLPVPVPVRSARSHARNSDHGGGLTGSPHPSAPHPHPHPQRLIDGWTCTHTHVGGIFIAVSSGLPIPEALILIAGEPILLLCTVLVVTAVPWQNRLKQGQPKSARSSPASFFSAAFAPDILGELSFADRTWSTSSGCTIDKVSEWKKCCERLKACMQRDRQAFRSPLFCENGKIVIT